MTTAAKINFGVAIAIALVPTAAGANLAELLSLTPPPLTRDTIDVTTHDSANGVMEFIPEGVFEIGDIKGQIHYIAGSSFDGAARTAVSVGTLVNYKITVKGAAGNVTISGVAIMTEYAIDDMPVKGKQAASFTLKPSGTITQAAV